MTASPRPRPARRFATLSVLALGLIAPGVLCTPPVAVAAPEPAPIPRRWQLDIETSPLRTAVVNTPGVGPRAYFFMTFKVTNNSASDVLFAPAFELATDDMALLRSGRDVPVAVTNELKSRLQNPLIEDQISVVGTLLRGPENAKEGVVIWPIPAEHQHEVTVYCAGFSGETAIVEVPVMAPAMASMKMPAGGGAAPMPAASAGAATAPMPAASVGAATVPMPSGKGASGASIKSVSATSLPKTEKKVLRKTLMLRYQLPGDLHPGEDAPLRPVETRWIMR